MRLLQFVLFGCTALACAAPVVHLPAEPTSITITSFKTDAKQTLSDPERNWLASVLSSCRWRNEYFITPPAPEYIVEVFGAGGPKSLFVNFAYIQAVSDEGYAVCQLPSATAHRLDVLARDS